MAEGIKIRELDVTTSLVDSDVLVLDNITADDLTTAVTKQIRYDDFVADLTGRDLVFSGQVIFNADISFSGDVELELGQLEDVTLTDVKTNDVLVYDGTKWINGESAGGVGDYIALKCDSEVASEENIVHIDVTIGNKVNHRFKDKGSSRSYYLDGEEAPFLILTPGRTYIFHQDDKSNETLGEDPNQYRLTFYPWVDKGPPFNFPIDFPGLVEYSNEDPGTTGYYTKLVLIENYQYIQIYYQAKLEEYMGNGIFNPDGQPSTIFESRFDSLQQQINSITEQLSDLIEIEEG